MSKPEQTSIPTPPNPSHETQSTQVTTTSISSSNEQRPFGEWLPDPKPDYTYPPVQNLRPYGHVPVYDPNTTVHGMHIPNQSPNGSYFPPYLRHKDAHRVMHRHKKKQTWLEYFLSKCNKAWEFIKMSYWHVEPWVIRPLVAGLAFNIGIQIARVAVQAYFPSYFPTTVYLPLRANAKFYDMYVYLLLVMMYYYIIYIRCSLDSLNMIHI